MNIISRDWRALADFYITVFECRMKLPERNLKGEWVDRLTSLEDERIRGIHLYLPGYETDGPTLEIFEYDRNRENGEKAINLEGFAHIAFAVENVQEKTDLLLKHGGSLVGELIDSYIEGVGNITVVYARDPEGNIIEIQKWS